MHSLRDFLTTEVTDADLDGLTPSTASYEMTNPPAHLLRGGRDPVGWYIRFQDGTFEVGDYPLPASECDTQTVADYDTVAPTMRWTKADWDENVQAVAALAAEGKIMLHAHTDVSKWGPLSQFMLNVVRDRFYVLHSA